MNASTGWGFRLRAWLVGGALASFAAQAPGDTDFTVTGAALFHDRCATCHEQANDRVPSLDQLHSKAPAQVVAALRFGVMRAQAQGLTVFEMQLLAQFLTGTLPDEPAAPGPEANPCGAGQTTATLGRNWNGWGADAGNSRFQASSTLSADVVPRLKVKWAFGYRGSYVYGQPTVVDGTVYATSSTGRIYALDAASGCTRWTFDAEAGSRTAISVARVGHRSLAVFGDDRGNAYAVDAATGALRWKVRIEDHPAGRITGSPAVYRRRVYVPVSSLEEVASMDPRYPCCTFAGSVVALDLATGKVKWRTKMAPPAQPVSDPSGASRHFAPAGAPVWNSPAIDARRGVLYVGTGNSYTSKSLPNSDAVVALDLATGRVRWSRQLTAADNYIVGCPPPPCAAGRVCPPTPNCPDKAGPDVDFGAAIILRSAGAQHDVLLASQKSGVVYALDPARKGALIWERRVGTGSPLGGIEWGSAADLGRLYAPVSDVLSAPGTGQPGLVALELRDGAVAWRVAAPTGACNWQSGTCLVGFQQATTVIPGVVFAGGLDGHLRAYAARDGALLWDLDTAIAYSTVNGVPADGGSLDLGGAVAVGPMLFVNSGYGRLVGRPGNVLLALSADGQ